MDDPGDYSVVGLPPHTGPVLFDCPACERPVLAVSVDTATWPPQVVVSPCGHDVSGWWSEMVAEVDPW